MSRSIRQWLVARPDVRGPILGIVILGLWELTMAVVFLGIAGSLVHWHGDKFWPVGVINLRVLLALIGGGQLGTGFARALVLWDSSRRDEALHLARLYAITRGAMVVLAVAFIDFGFTNSLKGLTSTETLLAYFFLDLSTEGCLHACILLFVVSPFLFREDKDKVQITEDWRF